MDKLFERINHAGLGNIGDLIAERTSSLPIGTQKQLSCTSVSVPGQRDMFCFTWVLKIFDYDYSESTFEEKCFINNNVFKHVMEGMWGKIIKGIYTWRVEEYLLYLHNIDREDKVSFSGFVEDEFEMTKLFVRFVFEESEQ